MKLLVDVGNTRLKWALWDGELQPGEPLLHQGDPWAAFASRTWPAVEEVWLSAVPRLGEAARWQSVVQASCGIAPQLPRSRAEWQGLRNVYPQPERLGIDRWLAMVAVWQQRRGPFVVLSAGTALTFDRVDREGRHLGGIIAPGYGSALASLLQVTATATPAAVPADPRGLGTNSETAIRQGALFAALGAVEHCLRAPGEDPEEALVLTGGDAALLLPQLPGAWQLRPQLVLEGLLALSEGGLAR